MRRILISLSSLIVTTTAFLGTGTAAFAMRVVPPGSGPAVNTASVVHHSGGLDTWVIALIAVTGVIVLGALTIFARLGRAAKRYSSTPATA